jgi:hypothetical protein
MSHLCESEKNAAEAPTDRSAEIRPISLYVLGNFAPVEKSAASADAVRRGGRKKAALQNTEIWARQLVRFPRYLAKRKFRGNSRREISSENFADFPEE